MLPIRYTSNLFLRAVCVVYLFSFLSFYIQIPGLYGDNGILPAKSALENNKYKTWSAKVHYQPTILWLAPFLGLSTQYALDVLAILGSFLAFTGFVSQKFCTIPLFAGLWSLYFSLYQVGQVFVQSQWDNLLLEVGFLSLFIAPLLPGRLSSSQKFPTKPISFWLVKWALFRFIFSAGVVKLSSGCPQWWDLTVLSSFFEKSILPTPVAWYVHHLPVWVLRLAAVSALVNEILLPFLFFVPIRSIRIFGYSIQLILQITMVLTGNYNFVNLLLVAMLLSLLDDKLFFKKSSKSVSYTSIFGQIANVLVHAGIIYITVTLFNLKVNGSQIDAKTSFSKDQFSEALKYGILVSLYVGALSLGIMITKALKNSLFNTSGIFTKLAHLLGTVFYSAIAVALFSASTVPLCALHPATNATINPTLRTVYNRIGKLHVVNDFISFGKLYESKGRTEIVLEGSNHIEGPWEEYQFLYKPGNVNHSLPFVAPYAPRVDWQMAFAAQSTYKDQPWLLSFVHRLLLGVPEVNALVNIKNTPFFKNPPKFIRGVSYLYKYTPWSKRGQPMWWQREKVAEYFPAYSKDSPALVEYLKARSLLPVISKEEVNPIWKNILDRIRYGVTCLEATIFLWSIFTTGCVIISTKSK